MNETTARRMHRSIPYHLVIGLVLIGVWWPVAWLDLQPFSEYYFFPLWLGYVLTVDGLVLLRTGTSLWSRDRKVFLLLFPLSSGFWWIFEGLNEFLENWHYVLPGESGTVYYVIHSTLSFSVVIPAVLGTIELVASFRIGERIPGLGHWRFGSSGLLRFQIAGLIMLGLIAIWPNHAFALVWLALFFIIEPINQRVRQRSLWQFARENQWGPVYNVMIGTTVTGFFWEMWNVFALPKWVYDVPFVHVLQIFEMPALGYFGYMPFGLEVVSFTSLFLWFLGYLPQRYVRLGTGDLPSERQPSARYREARA